jgi:hypothetical protein
VGISSNKTRAVSNRKLDAAQAVLKTKTNPARSASGNKKVWNMSEIQSMKPWDFEKYEAEIDAAMQDGRVNHSA